MPGILERQTGMGKVEERLPEALRPPSTRSPEWRGGALLALQALHWLGAGRNQRVIPSTPAGRAMGNAAGIIGRGLLAGLAGTVAITLVAAADKWIRGRMGPAPAEPRAPFDPFHTLIGPWVFSADVVGKILGGVTPVEDRAKERLAWAAHVGYGTMWGASLGVLDLVGIRGPGAMLGVLGGQLSAEMLAMPAAKFFPPVTQWGSEAVISSAYQHAVYAIAAGLTFEFLEPSR